jgi:hypothetical protein
MISTKSVAAGILSLSLVGLAIGAPAAGAATSYLRPNGVISSSGWSVVGAPNASEAIDDNVLETETPTSADYIANSGSSGSVQVDLSTVSLSGLSGVVAQAWFYTATPSPLKFFVKEKGGAASVGGTVSSAGWHSFNLFLTGGQTQLDNAYFEVLPATGSGSRQVSAAFIKLTYASPSSSVYWGAWMDGDVPLMKGQPPRGDAPWNKPTWEEFKFDAGRKVPSIIHFGQPPPWLQPFSKEPLELSAAKEAIPMMDMSSDLPTYSRHVSLAEIAEGKVDSDLETWASAAAVYGKPFFFRFDWEMNLPPTAALPWTGQAYEKPSDFVHAWQRFHDITEQKGATNITWVWCPNVKFAGTTPLVSLWPGPSYVDWNCMDGYNHGTNPLQPSSWVSFYNLFAPTYTELTSGPTAETPVMIGETASTEVGGSKADWITDALTAQLPQNFPKVKALVWFNWNIEDKPSRWDWPIESSGASEVSFASAVSAPYYAAGTFGSLPPLTKIKPLP